MALVIAGRMGGMEKGERLRVGRVIRLARVEQGLTQADLAERLGVSVTTVSNYERGLRAGISEKVARDMEKALGVNDRRLSVALGFAREAPTRDGRPAIVYEPPRLSPDQETETLRFVEWLRFRDKT